MFEDMEDEDSGLLLVENESATVAVNRSHHPNRQRFTAAHELGHFYLHCQSGNRLFVDQAYFRGPGSSTGIQQEEIEANQFAAELLMPEHFMQEACELPISDLDVLQLSRLFRVSEQAMMLRLVNLEYVS